MHIHYHRDLLQKWMERFVKFLWNDFSACITFWYLIEFFRNYYSIYKQVTQFRQAPNVHIEILFQGNNKPGKFVEFQFSKILKPIPSRTFVANDPADMNLFIKIHLFSGFYNINTWLKMLFGKCWFEFLNTTYTNLSNLIY